MDQQKQINIKGQFTISSYLIGIVIFTAVIFAGISIIGEFRAVDSTFMDKTEYDAFNNTFNYYDDLRTQTDLLKQNTVGDGAKPDIGAYGVVGGLINSAWASLKFIFTGFGFMDTAFTALSIYLGVPTWAGQLIIAAITISLVFAIIRLLFGMSEA